MPVADEVVGIAAVELDALGVGTAAAALTPRLPISVESNGIPLRAAPVDVVGDADTGDDDEATLLEPEPHIPDSPDVSSVPEDVDNPVVGELADDVDTPEEDVNVPDNVMVPVIAPVAGAAAPTATPPPS